MEQLRRYAALVLIGGLCSGLGPGDPAPTSTDARANATATTASDQEHEQRFHFKKLWMRPWKGKNGVLAWLSDTTGLPIILSVVPQGTVTFMLPAGRYTLDEIIAFLDQDLARQKMGIVRRQDHIELVCLDGPQPLRLLPRVLPSELRYYHRNEFVCTRLPAPGHLGEVSLALVARRLLGPNGRVIPLPGHLRLIGQVEDVERVLRAFGFAVKARPAKLANGSWHEADADNANPYHGCCLLAGRVGAGRCRRRRLLYDRLRGRTARRAARKSRIGQFRRAPEDVEP